MRWTLVLQAQLSGKEETLKCRPFPWTVTSEVLMSRTRSNRFRQQKSRLIDAYWRAANYL